jgi:hypothetical protein
MSGVCAAAPLPPKTPTMRDNPARSRMHFIYLTTPLCLLGRHSTSGSHEPSIQARNRKKKKTIINTRSPASYSMSRSLSSSA